MCGRPVRDRPRETEGKKTMPKKLTGKIALAARLPKGFTEKSANVNGVRINYKIGGRGSVVVLIHGYAQTSHMWTPLMPLLAMSHTVIAPDLRGAGGSERTQDGYDKKTLAKDIRGLVHQLGYEQVQVVGHDIGLMVAYAYAAQYPAEVSKVVLMDAFLPGVGNWKDVWLLRDLWHFHHRPSEDGRERCVRHRGEGLRSLAHGGGHRTGRPGHRRVPQVTGDPGLDGPA